MGSSATDDGLFIFTRPDGTRVEPNGVKCFRGNISAPVQSAYRGFEESLRDYLTKHEPGLSITAETEPLPMARREHGLQSRDRVDAVSRTEGGSCGTAGRRLSNADSSRACDARPAFRRSWCAIGV